MVLTSRWLGVWTGHCSRNVSVLDMFDDNILSHCWLPDVAWRDTRAELMHLLSSQSPSACLQGILGVQQRSRMDQKYKYPIQFCTACSNSTEVREGNPDSHWYKWRQKHLPLNWNTVQLLGNIYELYILQILYINVVYVCPKWQLV